MLMTLFIAKLLLVGTQIHFNRTITCWLNGVRFDIKAEPSEALCYYLYTLFDGFQPLVTY